MKEAERQRQIWYDAHKHYEKFEGTEDKTLFELANVLPEHIIEQTKILERNYLRNALKRIAKYLDPEVVKACKEAYHPIDARFMLNQVCDFCLKPSLGFFENEVEQDLFYHLSLTLWHAVNEREDKNYWCTAYMMNHLNISQIDYMRDYI